jgi:hypothetical protein
VNKLIHAAYRSAYTSDDPVIAIVGQPGLPEAKLPAVATEVEHTPGLDVIDEVGMRVDRRLVLSSIESHEVDPGEVEVAFLALTEGGYRLPGEATIVRFAGGERAADRVTVTGTDRVPVALTRVAGFGVDKGPVEIRRSDGSRWVGIRVRNDVDAVRSAVQAMHVPAGYTVGYATGEP